jgi:hypothetical protein
LSRFLRQGGDFDSVSAPVSALIVILLVSVFASDSDVISDSDSDFDPEPDLDPEPNSNLNAHSGGAALPALRFQPPIPTGFSR